MENLARIIESLEALAVAAEKKDEKQERAVPDIPKCSISQAFCKNKGNDHYKQKEYMEALVAYNRSLCHTPAGSKDFSLIYASRSAVYFDAKVYSKCIENIKLARENGFPQNRISELDAREKACQSKVDEIYDPWTFFKLSHPANEKIPFIVKTLELRVNEKFGRHIVTNRDLQAGDIIAIEEPYFTFWHESCDVYRCCICLKSNFMSLIPCLKCAKVMYCSNDCRRRDIVHMVKHDEKNPKNVDLRPESYRLALRMQVHAFDIGGNLKQTLSLIEKAGPKTVFDFDWSNRNDPSYDKNQLICVNSLSKVCIDPVPEDPNATTDENLMMQFTHDQLRIHQTNSYNMNETRQECMNPNKDPFHNNLLGTGVYPFAALLNNSCYPNVKQITVDNKFVLVVIRPIVAQEQIFISYGFNSFRCPRKVRQEKLFGFYKFYCTCIACERNYPMADWLLKADKKYIEPKFSVLPTIKSTIALFNKNCAYINRRIRVAPTYECTKLMQDTDHLLHSLARVTLDQIS